jgi:hypothetical protein
MSRILKYGDVINLENGYKEWTGGYLDSYGESPDPNMVYNVLTSEKINRSEKTGKWMVESDGSKNIGDEVTVGDVIYLKNQFGKETYLGICGGANKPNKYGVYTADKEKRPLETMQWVILSETGEPLDGKIRDSDVLMLLNCFSDNKGGYLDSMGNAGQPDTKYDVSTSAYSDRAKAGTAKWRLIFSD